MTRLESIDAKLDFLLSQYEKRKGETGYRLALAVLTAERRALLKKSNDAQADV